jgi:phospholipase C
VKSTTLGSCAIAVAAAAAWLSGCGGSQPPIGAPGAMPQALASAVRVARSQSPVQHIVVLVQESRTFNDFFATTKVGKMRVGHRTIRFPLKEVDLNGKGPQNNLYQAYLKSYRDGHMDGFNLANGSTPYQYVKPSEIQPY